MLGVGLRADPSLLFTTGEAHALGLKEIALAELEIVIEDAVKMPTLPVVTVTLEGAEPNRAFVSMKNKVAGPRRQGTH